MRQILIKQNKDVKTISGNRFDFCAKKDQHDLVLSPDEVKIFKFPFKVDVVSGGKIDLDFTLAKQLAVEGVMLLGAYLENGKVTIALMNLSKDVLHLEDEYTIAYGTLVEIATFRQVAEGTVGLVTVEPSKKKKGRKKA